MWKLRLIRALQRCLFFLPVKKNRILFYVNKRRGFGCNLKYVALEMLRRFGAGVELIWATDYPETCGEIEKLVVRNCLGFNFRNSLFKHFGIVWKLFHIGINFVPICIFKEFI